MQALNAEFLFNYLYDKPYTIRSAILHALAKNNPDLLMDLIKLGISPSIKDRNGRALVHTLAKNNPKLLPTLIKLGANPNAQDNDGKTILHILAGEHPELLPALLELGAKPNIEDNHKRDAVSYLNLLHTEFNVVSSIMEYGGNPNSIDRTGLTLLHSCLRLFSFAGSFEATSKLLQFGADPNIDSKQPVPIGTGGLFYDYIKPLDLFFNTLDAPYLPRSAYVFTEQEQDLVLLLVENGAHMYLQNTLDYRVFEIVYERYPAFKNYITSETALSNKFLINKLKNPIAIAKTIDITSLHLEAQCLFPKHKARNHFLNTFLTLLSRSNSNPFKQFPLELILHIASFFDFASMEKSHQEGLSLVRAISDQSVAIEKLAKNPGGICVLQRESHTYKSNPDGGAALQEKAYSFTFFNSAKILCRTFYELQKTLKQKQTLSALERFQGEKFSEDSKKELAKFRKEYAVSCWNTHLSLYQRPQYQSKLFNAIKDSQLYQDIEFFYGANIPKGFIK